MKKFKEILKRIGELINSFANPVLPEKSFDELAVAAGIGENETKLLKASMGGISWDKFAGEEETLKKTKAVPKKAVVNEIQPERVIKRTERGIDRD